MRAFGQKNAPKIWLHAVSVGETMAARPIARALKNEIGGVQIALSSTTDTGHDIAKTFLQNGEVDAIFYFPLDLAPLQNRILTAIRPDAIGFVETELWPNLLHLARKRGISTFLVNGRVSDNLLKTAPKLGPFWKWMSGNVSRFLMRGEEDAQRLQKLGVADSKIAVTGDVKLENPPVSSVESRRMWRRRLGIEDEPLFLAGSTHAGEEEAILHLAAQSPQVRFAIAPRHIERAEEVSALIEGAGFEVARRSKNQKLGEKSLYLLDSVGELADFYAACDLAFVGGSLIPRGGHSLLEPVLRGAPVLFGPHVQNFRAAAALVIKNELGSQLSDERELEGALQFWLNPVNRADFAARVQRALSPHQGAARRLAQRIKEEINHRDTETPRK